MPTTIPAIIQKRLLCLASSSPRRHELLKRYGLAFDSCDPDIDEKLLRGESVQAYGLRIAYEKAVVGSSYFSDSIVVAGDTTVYHNQQVLGKPGDPQDACSILTRLSGQRHQVYSAYVLLDARSGVHIEASLCTEVQFKRLPSNWVRWYVGTGESLDKAGAYSIQGLGTVMVEKIQGSFNNVVGFPIEDIFWHFLEQGWIELSEST